MTLQSDILYKLFLRGTDLDTDTTTLGYSRKDVKAAFMEYTKVTFDDTEELTPIKAQKLWFHKFIRRDWRMPDAFFSLGAMTQVDIKGLNDTYVKGEITYAEFLGNALAKAPLSHTSALFAACVLNETYGHRFLSMLSYVKEFADEKTYRSSIFVAALCLCGHIDRETKSMKGNSSTLISYLSQAPLFSRKGTYRGPIELGYIQTVVNSFEDTTL